jgi:hypothetical protein
MEMINMIKKAIGFMVVLFMSSQLQASQFMIGLSAGSNGFDNDYKTATEVGLHTVFASRIGVAIDGSLSYFEADANTGGGSVKAVPALVGLSYIFGNRLAQPYVGAEGGFTFLGGDANEVAMTYGAKAGVSVSLSREFRVFIEAKKLVINADSLRLEPTKIALGCSVIFGKPAANAKEKKLPFMERRPKAPKPPRAPRGRRAY